MFPMDMNRAYLQWGMCHPIYGPALIAYYMSMAGPAMAYGWYTEWVKLLIDATYVPKHQKPI